MILGTEMIFDERLQIDITQDVATVSNERSVFDKRLYILHSAARLEQLRLMSEHDRMACIFIVGKKVSK